MANKNDLVLRFNPFDYPVIFQKPEYLQVSSWIEHIPAAMLLIDMIRPKIFVELGTHYGVSYCAFCQAAKEVSLDSTFYAVDTWEGDYQAGHYGSEVLETLKEYHDKKYGEFSTLIQKTFDDAVNDFQDHSINLLHIDGCHTYEAVKHDYNTWLSKLAKGAVVVFHDVTEFQPHFGVWKFWEEISFNKPSFKFLHEHGLGILAIDEDYPSGLDVLFKANSNDFNYLNDLMYALGHALSEERTMNSHNSALKKRELEIRKQSEVISFKDKQIVSLENQVKTNLDKLLENKLTISQISLDFNSESARAIKLQQELEDAQIVIKQKQQELEDAQIVVKQKQRELEEVGSLVSSRDEEKLVLEYRVNQGEEEKSLLNQKINFQESLFDKITSLRSWKLVKAVRKIATFPVRFFTRIRYFWKLGKPHKVFSMPSLFDEQWYLLQNPDVKLLQVDPFVHYVKSGWKEGRDPNPLFDVDWYLANNPDVARDRGEVLLHYMKHGWRESRNPSSDFNAVWYLNRYPDVLKSGMDPLTHYLKHGKKEGRIIKPPSFLSEHSDGTKQNIISEDLIKNEIEQFALKPLISIIIPVYNTPVNFLVSLLDSIKQQLYTNWEICICDDASSNSETVNFLRELDGKDKRLKIKFSQINQNISKATNLAVEFAEGEYLAFIDHDDEITKDALYEIVKTINQNPCVDAIYSDQDKIDGFGETFEPFYKPDWSPTYLESVMYVGHLLVASKEVFYKAGQLNSEYDGVQDYEFMLRVSEITNYISHIPKILYHWRTLPGSIASDSEAKGKEISSLQVEAVNAHLKRVNYPATAQVNKNVHASHRLTLLPEDREEFPLISIIVTTKDAPKHISNCLASIFSKTTYKNFEVVVVDNETTDREALRVIQEYPVKVVPFKGKFNYSAANNRGVKNSEGEFVILLNNDTQVVTPNWLETMLFYNELPGIGAVGPMLVYPDKTVQHAGVVLGFRGTADHIMRGFPYDVDGYFGSLSCTKEVSAVTGACLMMKKENYESFGGLDELFGTHYQDVDLCLKILSKGERVLFIPQVILVHDEGSSRGKFYDHLDRALLLDSWGDFIRKGDPFYNPNLPLTNTNYSFD